MTTELIEQGLDLEHQIGHLDLQIRKCREAIAFMEKNGTDGYVYTLRVDQSPLVKFHNCWHFLPEYLLEMLKPQLAKFEEERATIKAQFEAL